MSDPPELTGDALRALVHGVELLSLDAGNTVIFLDHARLAALLARAGFAVSVDALIRHEGEAKRMLEDGTILRPEWAHRGAAGAIGWGNTVGTIVHLAGVPREAIAAILETAWAEHVALNFWSLVPEGLAAALNAIRALGVKVVIVSNSEGMLEPLFARLGVLSAFDRVVDSGKVGVEKPDPKIFELALAPYGIAPGAALHLGDTYATDIEGARAAGLRFALIDPYAHYEGRHQDIPRVHGAVAVADAILLDRSSIERSSTHTQHPQKD